MRSKTDARKPRFARLPAPFNADISVLDFKLLRRPRIALNVRVPFAIVTLFIPVFFAACGTLETVPAHDQQDSDAAVLEGYWHYLFLYTEQLGISSVDGKRASGFLGYVNSVKLAPAKHWIEITVQRNYGNVARCAFELEFDARRHYQIKTPVTDGLLARPASSPYRAAIAIEIAAPGKSTETRSAAATCTRGELLCRQNSECSPNHMCRLNPSFDFGTCNPDER